MNGVQIHIVRPNSPTPMTCTMYRLYIN